MSPPARGARDEFADILAELRDAELDTLGRLEAEACTPTPKRPPNADDLMLGGFLRFVAGKRPQRRRLPPP